MDSHQSDGKLNPRFSSFWKGKDKGKQAAPEGSATANDNQKQPAAVDIKLYNDGDRTLGRYKEAAIILDKAIKSNKGPWKSLDVPDISGEPESFDDIQFRNKLNGVLDSWENSVKDRAGWGKVVRHAVETVFTALSPFAKNALNIANNSQSIGVMNPFGLLFSGVLVLVTIADKEIARKDDVPQILDYLCQQLEQLDIPGEIPEEITHRDTVANRALDVRSACMIYLASQIRHDRTPFGTAGKIATTFFTGDTKITDTAVYLKTTIDRYNEALQKLNVRIALKVYQHLKWGPAPSKPVEEAFIDNFVVPYEENRRFTGRTKFLETLKKQLDDPNGGRRVALYGMGGIGKTQIALKFIYTHRTAYDRIYWIRAADQDSLLSGYQTIAEKAALKGLQGLGPRDIAERVKVWLRGEKSWLIIFDNLDNIDVINGFLPENGSQKHTIITTRNPNADGIPAEGLEVSLLDDDDAIQLLSKLSKLSIAAGSEEEVLAKKIVGMLGHLPLALEQAASYIRCITGDLVSFIETYNQNHKDIHDWVPEGYRPYPFSVATTWSMSFNHIRDKHPAAAELFRFLSFLNPDGVLVQFLRDGEKCFEEPLGEVISNETQIKKELIKLEKLSLLKWDRPSKQIIIHRLVQTVVRDEIPKSDSLRFEGMVISLCDTVFPEGDKIEDLPRSRMYVGQVLGPLLRLKLVRTERFASVMFRVGHFLLRNGKIVDAELALLLAREISIDALGKDDLFTHKIINYLGDAMTWRGKCYEALEIWEEEAPWHLARFGPGDQRTLMMLHNRAVTYRMLGKIEKAAELFEDALEKEKMYLAEDHRDTLQTMTQYAIVLRMQGKRDEMLRIREHVLKATKRICGDTDPDTIVATSELADALYVIGRYEEAIKLEKEVLGKYTVLYGADDWRVLEGTGRLGGMYYQQGLFTEALELLEPAVTKATRVLSLEHPVSLLAKSSLGLCLIGLRRFDDGVAQLEEVVETSRRFLGESNPTTLSGASELGWAYFEQGRLEDAAKLLEEVLEKVKRKDELDYPGTLVLMHNLAKIYCEQRRFKLAASMGEEALLKRKQILGAHHPHTLSTLDELAIIYWRRKRWLKAIKTRDEWRRMTRAHERWLAGQEHAK